MRNLEESSRYWELIVEVGNDFGVPSYTETRKFDTKEELNNALEKLDYYNIPHGVKEVVEYKIKYDWEDEEED